MKFFAIDWSELSLQLVVTFGHFLWQAIVVAIALLVVQHVGESLRDSRVLRHRRSAKSSVSLGETDLRGANLRYKIACLAFFSLPICVVATFAMVHQARGSFFLTAHNPIESLAIPAAIENQSVPPLASDSVQMSRSTEMPAEPLLTSRTQIPFVEPIDKPDLSQSGKTWAERTQLIAPYLLIAYAIGAGLMLSRFGISIIGSSRLRRMLLPIPDCILLKIIAEQASRLGLKRVPIVAICQRVTVPVVVGIVKPMILLPPALLCGLDPTQLAEILSHEMAHIRRYDLIVNLLQRIVEALLFFHPVTWWISRRVSIERENCCDDVAAALTGRLSYATALLQMAELCMGSNRRRRAAIAALSAAGGNTTDFGYRIRRLINAEETTRIGLTLRSFALGLTLLSLLMVSLVAWWQNGESTDEKSKDEAMPKIFTPEPLWLAKVAANEVASEMSRVSPVVIATDRVLTIGKNFDLKTGQQIDKPFVRLPQTDEIGVTLEPTLRRKSSDRAFIVEVSNRGPGNTFSEPSTDVRVLRASDGSQVGGAISIDSYFDTNSCDVDVENGGNFLLLGMGNEVRVYRTETGAIETTMPVKTIRIDAVAFSPNREWLVVSDQNDLHFWRWRDQAPVKTIHAGRKIDYLVFTPDGQYLAEGPDTREDIQIRDMRTLEVIASLKDEVGSPLMVSSMDMTPDGRYLVAHNEVSVDQTKMTIPHRIHLWDLKVRGKPVFQIATGEWVRSVAFSDDGHMIVGEFSGAAHGALLAAWKLPDELIRRRVDSPSDAKDRLGDGIQWSRWGDKDGLLSGARLVLPEGGLKPGQPLVVEYRLANVSTETKTLKCYLNKGMQFTSLGRGNRIGGFGLDWHHEPVTLTIEPGEVFIDSEHLVSINTTGLEPDEYQAALGSAFRYPDSLEPNTTHEIPHRGRTPFKIVGESTVKITELPKSDIHWGKPIAGLQLGAKFIGDPKSYSIGATVEADLFVANVTDQPIEFSIILPHPADGWLFNVEDRNGDTIMLQRPIPIGSPFPEKRVLLKLAPGEISSIIAGQTNADANGATRPRPKFEIADVEIDEARWSDYTIKGRLVTQGGSYSTIFGLALIRPEIPAFRLELDSGNVPFTVLGNDPLGNNTVVDKQEIDEKLVANQLPKTSSEAQVAPSSVGLQIRKARYAIENRAESDSRSDTLKSISWAVGDDKTKIVQIDMLQQALVVESDILGIEACEPLLLQLTEAATQRLVSATVKPTSQGTPTPLLAIMLHGELIGVAEMHTPIKAEQRIQIPLDISSKASNRLREYVTPALVNYHCQSVPETAPDNSFSVSSKLFAIESSPTEKRKLVVYYQIQRANAKATRVQVTIGSKTELKTLNQGESIDVPVVNDPLPGRYKIIPKITPEGDHFNIESTVTRSLDGAATQDEFQVPVVKVHFLTEIPVDKQSGPIDLAGKREDLVRRIDSAATQRDEARKSSSEYFRLEYMLKTQELLLAKFDLENATADIVVPNAPEATPERIAALRELLRIRWGLPVDGIQVGLGKIDDRYQFEPSEKISFQVYIRNITEKQITQKLRWFDAANSTALLRCLAGSPTNIFLSIRSASSLGRETELRLEPGEIRELPQGRFEMDTTGLPPGVYSVDANFPVVFPNRVGESATRIARPIDSDGMPFELLFRFELIGERPLPDAVPVDSASEVAETSKVKWGTPVYGLQAGARFRKNATNSGESDTAKTDSLGSSAVHHAHIGDTFKTEILVRNIRKQPIKVRIEAAMGKEVQSLSAMESAITEQSSRAIMRRSPVEIAEKRTRTVERTLQPGEHVIAAHQDFEIQQLVDGRESQLSLPEVNRHWVPGQGDYMYHAYLKLGITDSLSISLHSGGIGIRIDADNDPQGANQAITTETNVSSPGKPPMNNDLKEISDLIASGKTISRQLNEKYQAVHLNLTAAERLKSVKLLAVPDFVMQHLLSEPTYSNAEKVALLSELKDLNFGSMEFGLQECMANVATEYSKVDPAATREWLAIFQDAEYGVGMGLTAVLVAAKQKDPAISLEILRSLNDTEGECIVTSGDIPKYDLPASDWLKEVQRFQSQRLRSYFLGGPMVFRFGEESPEAALDYILTIPKETRNQQLGYQLVSSLLRSKRFTWTEILDWMETKLPIETRSPEHYGLLAASWSQQDNTTFQSWFQSLSDAAIRDEVIIGFAGEGQTRDWPEILKLASSIRDQTKRQAKVAWVLDAWKLTDPAAALAQLDDADVSKERRTQLHRDITARLAQIAEAGQPAFIPQVNPNRKHADQELLALQKMLGLMKSEPDKLHGMAIYDQNPMGWKWRVYLPPGRNWQIKGQLGRIPKEENYPTEPSNRMTAIDIAPAATGRVLELEGHIGREHGSSDEWQVRVEADGNVFQGVDLFVLGMFHSTEKTEVAEFVTGKRQGNLSIGGYTLAPGSNVTSKINNELELMRWYYVPKEEQENVAGPFPGFVVWIAEKPKMNSQLQGQRTEKPAGRDEQILGQWDVAPTPAKTGIASQAESMTLKFSEQGKFESYVQKQNYVEFAAGSWKLDGNKVSVRFKPIAMQPTDKSDVEATLQFDTPDTLILDGTRFLKRSAATPVVLDAKHPLHGIAQDVLSKLNASAPLPENANDVVRMLNTRSPLETWQLVRLSDKPTMSATQVVDRFDASKATGYRLLFSRDYHESANTMQQAVLKPTELPFRVRTEQFEIVLFADQPLKAPPELRSRIAWLPAKSRWPTHDICLGDGLGYTWFVRAPIQIVHPLKSDLQLAGGDDMIASLVQMTISMKGFPHAADANTVSGMLANYGDRAVTAVEQAVRNKKPQEDLWHTISSLAYIRTDSSTRLLNQLYQSEDVDIRNAATYALIHVPYRQEASQVYLDLLKNRMRVEEASAACVALGLKDAIPILKELFANASKPSSLRELNTIFAARRTLEENPIPKELLDAFEIIFLSSAVDSIDQGSAVGKAIQRFKDSKDEEAVVVLALQLVGYTNKANVNHICAIGAAILREKKTGPATLFLKSILDSLPERERVEVLQKILGN